MSENKTAENKNKQSDNILEVSHLKKYFPIKGGMFGKQVGAVKAVDDVSFTLREEPRWVWLESPDVVNLPQEEPS